MERVLQINHPHSLPDESVSVFFGCFACSGNEVRAPQRKAEKDPLLTDHTCGNNAFYYFYFILHFIIAIQLMNWLTFTYIMVN